MGGMMPKRKPKKIAAKRKGRSKSSAKVSKNAVTLVVVLRAKPGQESLLEAELRALIHPTRLEQGCITYDLHRAADSPGAFFLHETWASREHHGQHTKTAH